MARIQITDEQVHNAISALNERMLQTLEKKGYGAFASTHEILGVLTEEQKELVDAVQDNGYQHIKIRNELLDIAVAATFAVACIDAEALEW